MNYTQEHYLSDLFVELRDNHNFKSDALKKIVNISNDINEFSSHGRNDKIIKNTSIRVFEIIALNFFEKNIQKEDISVIANKIINSDLFDIYSSAKKKLKKGLKIRNFEQDNNIVEIKTILSQKLDENDTSNSLNLSKLLFHLIEEFSIENNNPEINIDYIEDEILSLDKQVIQNNLLDSVSRKIFLQNIDDDFYKKINDSFYEKNINIEKLDKNYSFNLINQFIFSEIIYEYSVILGIAIDKKAFYSKSDIHNIINKLKLEDNILENQNILNNIYNKILDSNKNIDNPVIKKYFNNWFENIFNKIFNDFISDIKIMNSYDFLNKKNDYISDTNVDLFHKSDLVVGNRGDIIYNFDNIIGNNNLLLLDNVEKIKNDISVLSPNKHNFENNILDLLKGFDSNISKKDYAIFYDNLLKNGISNIKLLMNLTNGLQAIKVLDNFYLYLKKNNLLNNKEPLLDEMIEVIISNLNIQNIGEMSESKNNNYSHKKINLLLFYLGCGIGNNRLTKIYPNKRINRDLEKKIINNVKSNNSILLGYNNFLKDYLNYSNQILESSLRKEKKLHDKQKIIDEGSRRIYKVSNNVLEYLNIYNLKQNCLGSLGDNINFDDVNGILIEYIDKRLGFMNIDYETGVGILPIFEINSNDISGLLFYLYLLNNFEYGSDIILQKDIRKEFLKQKRDSEKYKADEGYKKPNIKFILREKIKFLLKNYVFKFEQIKIKKLKDIEGEKNKERKKRLKEELNDFEEKLSENKILQVTKEVIAKNFNI